MSNRLIVDARWKGNFGIGRYSRELLSRINSSEAKYIEGRIPTKKTEILRSTMLLRGDIFYSPGFLPILQARTQVLTLHDLIHLEDSQINFKNMTRNLYYDYLRRKIQKKEILINTVSEHSKKAIIKWADISSDSLQIIANGLSSCFLPSNSKNDNRVNRSIGFVGNTKSHKNFPYFMKVASLLAPDWEVHIVGIGLEKYWRHPKRNVFFHENLVDLELSNI